MAVTFIVAVMVPAHDAAAVDEPPYFAAPVQWMVDERITTTPTASCFSPLSPVTRGETAEFLWRMEGALDAVPHPFGDVGTESLHAPVSWLFAEGITTGTTDTTYSPDATLTRGEFAALLHRLAGEPIGAPDHPFVDVIRNWQQGPVAWLFASGITTGTSETEFSPDALVTRGQIATFLYRYQGRPAVDLVADDGCVSGLPAPLAVAESESLHLLNELRAAMGRQKLKRNPVMDAFARDWSRVMHDGNFMRHSAGPYGENVAMTLSATGSTPEEAAERLHNLWVTSASHFDNMTNEGYSSVGIGFWNGPGGWYATHVFSHT